MQSNIKESGLLKISVEEIKLKSITLGNSQLMIKVDKNPKWYDLVFFQQVANIMQFFIYHANTNSTLSFQLIDPKSNMSLAQCQFNIGQLCKRPYVRHCLEVELSNCQKSGQKTSYKSVGALNCQLLFLKDQIGELQVNVFGLKLVDNLQDTTIFMKLNGEKNKVQLQIQESQNFFINGDHTILQIVIKGPKQNRSIVEKQIDLYQEQLVQPSKEFRRRSFELLHYGTKKGAIYLQTRFTFHSLSRKQQLESKNKN